MKKCVFKIVLVVIYIMTLCVITSCKNNKQYSITYILNGGELSNPQTFYKTDMKVELPTPTYENYVFAGWYENELFNGDSVKYINTNSTGNKTFYAKWNKITDPEGLGFNVKEFNGNGLEFGIKISQLQDSDPFNENYDYPDKALKQSIQKSVERAYNIKIIYSEYDKEAPWGPDRVKYIKMSFQDKSYLNSNIYVLEIDSTWIPELVKAQVLAELYNIEEDSGIFKDLGYKQSTISNDVTLVRKKVYGYTTCEPYGDNYLYYNIDKVKELDIEDPVELWFKGEWTWKKFDEWVKDAQTKLDEDEFVLDVGYSDFVVGASASLGSTIINYKALNLNFKNPTVLKVFDKIKYYYNNGYQNKKHGTHDVTAEFINGKTIINSGPLKFLKNEFRFYSDIKFKIGVVPYPISDTESVKIITESYSYNNSVNDLIIVDEPLTNRNNEVLKTEDGKDIYGIDLSETNYLNSITGNVNVYSIINYHSNNDLLTSDVAFNILYDLNNSLREYNTIENKVRKLVDYESDYKAILSTQRESNLCYDPIYAVSNSQQSGSCHRPNWYISSNSIVTSTRPVGELIDEIYEVYLHELELLY